MNGLVQYTCTPWRRIFALFPVILGSGDGYRIAWLRYVEARESTLTYEGQSVSDWEFREIPRTAEGIAR